MHGISRLPAELLLCQERLCCMEVVVKLFFAVFMEVDSMEDNKKKTVRYRKAIVLFVSFCNLV
jgi:hypothetical protein